ANILDSKEQITPLTTHEVVKPIHLPKKANILDSKEQITPLTTHEVVKHEKHIHPPKNPNILHSKPSSLFLKTKIITLIPLKSLTNTSIPTKNIPLFRLFIRPLKYKEIPTLHKIRDNRKEEFKQEKLECPHLSTVYDLLLVNDISHFESPHFYDKSNFLKTMNRELNNESEKNQNNELDKTLNTDLRNINPRNNKDMSHSSPTNTRNNTNTNISDTYNILNTFLSNKYTALQSSINTDTLLSLCLSLSNTKVRNNIIFKYLNTFLSTKNPYFFIILAGILENENITKNQLFNFSPPNLLYENSQKYFMDVFHTKNVFFIHFFVQKVLQLNRITGIYILTVYTLLTLNECNSVDSMDSRVGIMDRNSTRLEIDNIMYNKQSNTPSDNQSNTQSNMFSLFPFLKYFCYNFYTLKFLFHLEIFIKKSFNDINIFTVPNLNPDSHLNSISYLNSIPNQNYNFDLNTLKYLYLQVCIEGNRKDIGGLYYNECKNIFTGNKLIYLDNYYKEKGWMPFFGFRSVVDRSISRIVGIEENKDEKKGKELVNINEGLRNENVNEGSINENVNEGSINENVTERQLKENSNKELNFQIIKEEEIKEFDFTKEEIQENTKEVKEIKFTRKEELKQEGLQEQIQEVFHENMNQENINQENINHEKNHENTQPSLSSSFYINKQYAQSFADFFTDEHTSEEVKTMDDSNITNKYFNFEDEPSNNIQSNKQNNKQSLLQSKTENEGKSGFFSFFNVFNRKKVQKVKLTGQSDFKYDPVSKKWVFSGNVSGGVSEVDKKNSKDKKDSKDKSDSKEKSDVAKKVESKEPLPPTLQPTLQPIIPPSTTKQSSSKKMDGRISSRYVISKGKPKSEE
ncbi:hypothetical protein CWI38_1559p0020, partial [Hamiltosporidium tvaerminnensis]